MSFGGIWDWFWGDFLGLFWWSLGSLGSFWGHFEVFWEVFGGLGVTSGDVENFQGHFVAFWGLCGLWGGVRVMQAVL